MVVAVGAADYQIQPGDTVSELARDHGTTIDEIVEANGLNDPDLIIAGEKLAIPGQTAKHVVEQGDTLSEIAREYGVSAREIAEINGIADRDFIYVGSAIEIPVAAGETTVSHSVAPGETLAQIAARYGTTVDAIADLNDMSDIDLVILGSELLVTGSPPPEETTTTTTAPPTTTTTAAPAEVTHTVVFGETLSDIAALYGTSAAALIDANGIADPDAIVAGTVLVIPPAEPASGGGPDPSGMVCPVPSATFVDDYGVEKPDGRYHQGIDLFASRGTSVYAPVAGSLEAVNGNLGGLQFWLTAPDGTIYIGTHLDGFGRVGDVHPGDVVGIVGDSGNALGSPPHVHFEILVDGTAINPYQRLVEACR
jgi:LysM repeat protein